jgi:hypothetical protein
MNHVKLKTLMVITSFVALLFGLGFLLAPAWTEASYGVNLDAGGQLMARFLGSAYLGYAALLWLARNTPSSNTRHAIVVGVFVNMILGLVVAVYDRVMGIENALAWSTVAIFLLLSIGYGYFAFIKPNAD